MKRKILAAAFFTMIGLMGTLNAQAPYKHSIGATVGSMQAISYKTFVTDHFAIQVDLGTKITYTEGDWNVKGLHIYNLELNPNLMYEGNFVAGLYGFAGGGVSLGYCWDIWHQHLFPYDHIHNIDLGKFGINAILGLEYKLNIPLTLQLDFRPGYGMLFGYDYYYMNNRVWNYFDWSVNAGVRYTF